MKTNVPVNYIKERYPSVWVSSTLKNYEYKDGDTTFIMFKKMSADMCTYSVYSLNQQEMLMSSSNQEELHEAWNFIWGEGMILFV